MLKMVSCFMLEQKNVDISFSEAECVKIDPENKKIYCRSSSINVASKIEEEFVVDYDYLIIAVGAQVNTFNTPGVEENCHFLKVTFPFFNFIVLGFAIFSENFLPATCSISELRYG